ncbi:hypothetical protein [Aquimarina latercula]|uniref:hypothetical protein n=1 Tax=Aquimarina latercula TaxID=987 RepID=UPI000409DAC9|nr:hypothetical protein [Aquimarina latercula]
MKKYSFIKNTNQRYRAVSKSDFHKAYGCSPYAFRKCVKKIEAHIGLYKGGLYAPWQVEMIVKHLGAPSKLEHIIYEKY